MQLILNGSFFSKNLQLALGITKYSKLNKQIPRYWF